MAAAAQPPPPLEPPSPTAPPPRVVVVPYDTYHATNAEIARLNHALDGAAHAAREWAARYQRVLEASVKEKEALLSGIGQWQNACKRVESDMAKLAKQLDLYRGFNDHARMKLSEVCADNLMQHERIAELEAQVKAKTELAESINALPMPVAVIPVPALPVL